MKVSKVLIDITIDIVNQYNADQDCQKYKVKDKKQRRVAAVTSLDPNEIQGPEGYTNDHFIASKGMNYTIFFENQSTAGANAVEVFIYDTLSTTQYDMNTFAFDKLWISGTSHEVIADGNSFAMDIDMRPEINCIVRASGTLNPDNGAAYWHFMSLDPQTMDITEEPDAGFLPPNNEKPEGEGFVSYTVDLKEPFDNGDNITAQATIVFDFNNPIVTNLFSNTIDKEAPVSEVYDIQLYDDNDELHEIFWHASDYGSGTEYYNIYVSENNGDWEIWLSHTMKLSDTLRANPEHNYRFFAQGVDYLGNEEPWKGYAEMVLGMESYGDQGITFRVAPNPAGNSTTVICNVNEPQPIDMELYATDGRRVYHRKGILLSSGTNRIPLDVAHIAPGMYNLIIRSNGAISTGKVLKE